jgi:hypothetical protein
MADITYSFSDDQSEAVFSAKTPKGEDWMKDSEITMPISEAKECIEAARSTGLVCDVPLNQSSDGVELNGDCAPARVR